MPYGTIKVDTIIFTDNNVDKSVPVSGLVQNPTVSGNMTVTGFILGDVVRGGTVVSGLTVTGTTANFASGVFTTQVSGVTVIATTGNFTSLTGTTTTGTTANFASGVFSTQVTGTTILASTGTFQYLTGVNTLGMNANFVTGVIVGSGTPAAPSLSISGDPNTGIYSPGADQLAIATNGGVQLVVNSSGQVTLNALGTAAAPAYSWIGDPNTGFFRPNADEIAIATNGTQRLTVNGPGNIITTGSFVDPSIIGTILEDVFTITDGAAFEVDPGNGSIQLITLGASRTPKATDFVAGESITLMVNDGTAYTLTWTDATWGTGGVIWKGGTAPTLATTGYSVIQFWKVSSQVYGASVGDVA